ncbi:MAG: ABC transporter substrate binding protein [Isosphaeraceae bacterium]
MRVASLRRCPRVFVALLLAATGCGRSEPSASSSTSASATAEGRTSAPRTIAGGVATIAVIRVNAPTLGDEPSNADIDAGLQQAGIAPTAFKLVDYDAAGDIKAVLGLVEKARAARSDAIVTLLAESTLLAVGKTGDTPLFFSLVGEPSLLGLGKNDADHIDQVTGVYSAIDKSLMIPIARGCQPKAKVLGILYHADLPLSVAHKDALLRTNWDTVKPVTAAYHGEADLAKAIASLKDQQAEGIVLASGIGTLARPAINAARDAKLPVYGYLIEHTTSGAILARVITTRWNGFELGRRIGRVFLGQPVKQVAFGRGDNYKTYVNLGGEGPERHHSPP